MCLVIARINYKSGRDVRTKVIIVYKMSKVKISRREESRGCVYASFRRV